MVHNEWLMEDLNIQNLQQVALSLNQINSYNRYIYLVLLFKNNMIIKLINEIKLLLNN